MRCFRGLHVIEIRAIILMPNAVNSSRPFQNDSQENQCLYILCSFIVNSFNFRLSIYWRNIVVHKVVKISIIIIFTPWTEPPRGAQEVIFSGSQGVVGLIEQEKIFCFVGRRAHFNYAQGQWSGTYGSRATCSSYHDCIWLTDKS